MFASIYHFLEAVACFSLLNLRAFYSACWLIRFAACFPEFLPPLFFRSCSLSQLIYYTTTNSICQLLFRKFFRFVKYIYSNSLSMLMSRQKQTIILLILQFITLIFVFSSLFPQVNEQKIIYLFPLLMLNSDPIYVII